MSDSSSQYENIRSCFTYTCSCVFAVVYPSSPCMRYLSFVRMIAALCHVYCDQRTLIIPSHVHEMQTANKTRSLRIRRSHDEHVCTRRILHHSCQLQRNLSRVRVSQIIASWKCTRDTQCDNLRKRESNTTKTLMESCSKRRSGVQAQI